MCTCTLRHTQSLFCWMTSYSPLKPYAHIAPWSLAGTTLLWSCLDLLSTHALAANHYKWASPSSLCHWTLNSFQASIMPQVTFQGPTTILCMWQEFNNYFPGMTYLTRTCISLALILVEPADLKDVPSQQKFHCKLAPWECLIHAALFLLHPSGCP